MIKHFLIILAVLLLLTTSTSATLKFSTQKLKHEASSLQKQKDITVQQRTALIQIQEQQSKLQQQWKLLQGLRSGAAVKIMFEMIDSALSDDVWFLSWKFKRTGLAQPRAKTINKGYFIVVPRGQAITITNNTRLQTNMEITGQARDHSALSDFVQRLFKQPEIQDVRVVKTALRRYTRRNVIDFDLDVIVNTKVKDD